MARIEMKVNIPTTGPDYTGSMASQLFRVKKTQIEMMRDRGFPVDHEVSVLGYTVPFFIETYNRLKEASNSTFKGALSFLYQRQTQDPITKAIVNESVYVYYLETPTDGRGAEGIKKIGVEQIKQIIQLMEAHKLVHAILITETDLTPDAKKAFEDLPKYTMEHFLYMELGYNVTKHFMVPQHILLSRQEAADLLRRNRVDFNKLLQMSFKDPIARYYGARPGQIFQIHRENLGVLTLIDEYTAYRAVSSRDLGLPK